MRDNSKSNMKGIVIIFTVGVLLISYFIIKIINATPAAPPEDRLILVTSKDLDQGDVISVPEMQWKEFATDKIKPEYIRKDQHDIIRSIEGAIVRGPILKGNPISDPDIIKTGTKSALSTVVRHGMRAVPVPFTKLANAPTLISPGDIVDIIIPKRIPGQQQAGTEALYEAQTILRGIRILAVDTALQKSESTDPKGTVPTGNTPHTITLEVNASQAEDLAESIREGQIVISMHSIFAKEEDILAQPKKPTSLTPQIIIKEEQPKENKKEMEIGKEKEKVIKVIRGSDKKQ